MPLGLFALLLFHNLYGRANFHTFAGYILDPFYNNHNYE